MAEGGYDFDDENHHLLDEDDYDNDAYESIQMPLPPTLPTVNEGEQAETSFGGTGLSTTKARFRDSVIDEFYKQARYEPPAKEYNKFEYKDSILFLIKKTDKKNRIKCLYGWK